MQMYRGAVAQVFRRWMNAAHGPGQMQLPYVRMSLVSHMIFGMKTGRFTRLTSPIFLLLVWNRTTEAENAEPTRAT
jgi:hypothetical protein